MRNPCARSLLVATSALAAEAGSKQRAIIRSVCAASGRVVQDVAE